MTTPDYNDLTPPAELIWEAARGIDTHAKLADAAARWGARHGYEQARQLWPEPITDRPPTEADGDADGVVQVFIADGQYWSASHWSVTVESGRPWLHTPRWQPGPPSLQEQALKIVAAFDRNFPLCREEIDVIRRALEQAGEEQP
jgi:hypothetical protein